MIFPHNVSNFAEVPGLFTSPKQRIISSSCCKIFPPKCTVLPSMSPSKASVCSSPNCKLSKISNADKW